VCRIAWMGYAGRVWRVVLLVGTIVAVLLLGASVARDTTKEGVYYSCDPSQPKPQFGGCYPQYQTIRHDYTSRPHADQVRYLRFAAAGVFLVTLASLPLLGAGRRQP